MSKVNRMQWQKKEKFNPPVKTKADDLYQENNSILSTVGIL